MGIIMPQQSFSFLFFFRNVLVGKNNAVKISDFGLSRALAKDDSYYKLSQTLKLPVKWMALESLLYQKFSTYSDGKRFIIIYSKHTVEPAIALDLLATSLGFIREGR